MAKQKEEQQKPGKKHKQLNVFEGRWHTEGTVLANGGKLIGTDIYEWLQGGFFLLHKVEAEIGGSDVRALEVIGIDEGRIRTQSFDNTGNFSEYGARLRGRNWEIDGRLERFRGAFSSDRRMLTGRWETRPARGKRWTPWMDITLTKTG